MLTKIAHVDWFPSENPTHLLPDTLIGVVFNTDRIVFRVVNYRTNYSICFSADVRWRELLIYEVLFVLSKKLKLASNYFLGRHQ